MQKESSLIKYLYRKFDTPRLIIKPVEEFDREFYLSLYTSEYSMKYIANPLSLKEANKAFENSIKASKAGKGYMLFTIFNKADSQVIGLLLYQVIDDLTGQIGVMIGNKFSNQKFAQESITGIVNLLRNVSANVSTLIAKVNIDNVPSIQFLKKIGFEHKEMKGIDSFYSYSIR